MESALYRVDGNFCVRARIERHQCTCMSLAGGRQQVAAKDSAFQTGSLLLQRGKSNANKVSHKQQGTPIIFAAVDLKTQLKDYAAAEKRWQAQVSDGKVKSLSPKEAGYALQLSPNVVLLDVRPSDERRKAWVKKSVWIPAFDLDSSFAPGKALNKLGDFVMGGWWSGSRMMKRNERFTADVVAKIPKGTNIVVVCQKGLRSLAACEQLYKAGYRNLSWVSGGLDAAEEGDFEREGAVPFKMAGLGGVSAFLGFTDQQREQARKEGLKYRALLFGRLVALIVAADLLFVGAQQLVFKLHQ